MARRSVELLDLLTRAERLAARRVQSVLAEYDCTVEAWRVLDLLADGEGHHMTALAEHAFLPAPTLTKLVDQLVDQNLVFRRIDPADRRRVLAHLTPRGSDRHRLLADAVRADRGAWEPLLDPGDGRRLALLLDRLTSALHRGDGVSAARAERSAGRAR